MTRFANILLLNMLAQEQNMMVISRGDLSKMNTARL
jgi:hypothetical protein